MQDNRHWAIKDKIPVKSRKRGAKCEGESTEVPVFPPDKMF
jgi:hypothetical protein